MYKENWTQTWPMGSEIYPEVHENPRAFFSSSSPILLELFAHGSRLNCNYPSLKQHKHYSWFLGWNRWCWKLEHTNVYKLLGIVHYEFWAESVTEFSRHLEKNYKKRIKWFGLKEKIIKITQVVRKISVQKKKSEREVWLLFWLKICSIIGAYFIPILVPKFQLKISVKISVKARGLLSLFFIVFFTLL